MHAKWIAALLIGLLFGFLCGPGTSQRGVGQEPRKTTEMVDRFAPPDIKVGVKVQFISSQVHTMTEIDERAPKVSKVQGNWVYLDVFCLSRIWKPPSFGLA
jgi:hypothetical protein